MNSYHLLLDAVQTANYSTSQWTTIHITFFSRINHKFATPFKYVWNDCDRFRKEQFRIYIHCAVGSDTSQRG